MVRIDGGPPLADPETFQVDLAAALRATHNDDVTFARGHERHWYTQTKGADREFRDFKEEEIMALIEYMKTLK